MKCPLCEVEINLRPGGITYCSDLENCPMLNRDPLLQEREKTHGSFARNAEISQKIKHITYSYGYGTLPAPQREALDIIALKLSRILSGQANFKDHWDDIAGYAKLASEACD